MKTRALHTGFLWGFLFLLSACGEKDDYYYPSVSLEFVTVKAGSDGRLQTLLPDKGEPLSVSEDRTALQISPNTFRRVISNYETLTSGNGKLGARIYSMQTVVTPEPKSKTDPSYAEGLKTDPVDVISIWMGRDYLNMILNVKVAGRKQHVFGMVEESVEDNGAEKVVTLSLYHRADGDEEYYNRRAYISVPLQSKYGTGPLLRPVRIKFKYHTYDKEGHPVESDKYCYPGFLYTPKKK